MTGTVTLSMEVELGWGVHDIADDAHLSDDGVAERAYLGRLLDRCDALNVPISFDVVGHLLESDCDGDHDGPHAGDWFDADPGTDAMADPLFYAPDAVEAIRDRPTDHEICTHTYSHVNCDDVSAATLDWELSRCQRLHRRRVGTETVSIVPPRHHPPPRAALLDADIEVVRLSRDTSDRGQLSRLKELVAGPHPTFEPRLVDGVVETYCTTYPSLTASTLPLGKQDPPAYFSSLPVAFRQRLQRAYLGRAVDAAVESDGHCHLWSHLYDVANEYQWPVIDGFLSELAARRDAGEVQVLTMAALNDRVRGRAPEVTTSV
ncbi:polysaccharide deacetylase family protein [Halomicrobium salinisoli]|uniref:polysaccharide deacetylase family protein n=1 Tax=Halomicrobium salinisoli TaxID=2878391 RepID=UPI001CF015D7|nr:polysaccharide deacetylase family protein [Halomicrobium salinisoli]